MHCAGHPSRNRRCMWLGAQQQSSCHNQRQLAACRIQALRLQSTLARTGRIRRLLARQHSQGHATGFCIIKHAEAIHTPFGDAGHPSKNRRNVWVVARQHPGEAMAEWFMEGFLERLTDPHDAASLRILDHAVFYVVSFAETTQVGLCQLQKAWWTEAKRGLAQQPQPQHAWVSVICALQHIGYQKQKDALLHDGTPKRGSCRPLLSLHELS